jgi:hypothetical protein
LQALPAFALIGSAHTAATRISTCSSNYNSKETPKCARKPSAAFWLSSRWPCPSSKCIVYKMSGRQSRQQLLLIQHPCKHCTGCEVQPVCCLLCWLGGALALQALLFFVLICYSGSHLLLGRQRSRQQAKMPATVPHACCTTPHCPAASCNDPSGQDKHSKIQYNYITLI